MKFPTISNEIGMRLPPVDNVILMKISNEIPMKLLSVNNDTLMNFPAERNGR
jgi:hypothetical protein